MLNASFPIELEIKNKTDTVKSVLYLDLPLGLVNEIRLENNFMTKEVISASKF